jgi:membrane protease YdiL (CAAX protease family)
MVIGFYVLTPWLEGLGMTPYVAYMIGMGLPMLGMLVAAMVAYRLEGHPWTWRALMARFGYRRMTGADWLWTAGIFAIEMGAYVLFSRFGRWLIGAGVIPMPNSLPAFLDPQTIFTPEALDVAAGGLRGNWAVFALSVIVLVINVVGEEFLWRGVILPRQALAFGAMTWLVHGMLWNMFHVYKWWDLIGLLPLSLALTWVVLHRKNNTPGLIIHFITNGSGVISILLAVL